MEAAAIPYKKQEAAIENTYRPMPTCGKISMQTRNEKEVFQSNESHGWKSFTYHHTFDGRLNTSFLPRIRNKLRTSALVSSIHIVILEVFARARKRNERHRLEMKSQTAIITPDNCEHTKPYRIWMKENYWNPKANSMKSQSTGPICKSIISTYWQQTIFKNEIKNTT